MVRVFKLTIFKLTLCSIAKFELLVMQYEHNMKAHVYIQRNINRHISIEYMTKYDTHDSSQSIHLNWATHP